jgi:hypothetical protein
MRGDVRQVGPRIALRSIRTTGAPVGWLGAARGTCKSPHQILNLYQFFTNRPEDWRFWRSARSEPGSRADFRDDHRMEGT